MRSVLPPILLLLALIGFSLWNGSSVSREMDGCSAAVEHARTAAADGDWSAAEGALRRGYDRWQSRQTYLHIVEPHAAVEEAEVMFRRAFAFAAVREDAEFQAETAGLLAQLRVLAEMEQLRIGNIL